MNDVSAQARPTDFDQTPYLALSKETQDSSRALN